MPTTCRVTGLGLQVSKVLKRGDPPGGEAANPRPLLLVPGRHYEKVHLLPKYRPREAQQSSRLDRLSPITRGLVSASALGRTGCAMKSCCLMAEATGGTGAKVVVTDQGQNKQAVPPRPQEWEPAHHGHRLGPFEMPRLHRGRETTLSCHGLSDTG